MNTNDFIQKVEKILRDSTERGQLNIFYARPKLLTLFLEHEKLIREEERERILTAFNSNERVREGGCDGCDKNLEMIEQIRGIITPDSEKGVNEICLCGNRGYSALMKGEHYKDCPAAPKEKGWREGLRDLYLVKSPDDNGLITGSVTTAYGVFKASRPNLAFYLATQDSIEEFIERTLTQQKREIQNNIGFLRQWLNEDRIKDPKNLVTNEDIIYWLFPKP